MYKLTECKKCSHAIVCPASSLRPIWLTSTALFQLYLGDWVGRRGLNLPKLSLNISSLINSWISKSTAWRTIFTGDLESSRGYRSGRPRSKMCRSGGGTRDKLNTNAWVFDDNAIVTPTEATPLASAQHVREGAAKSNKGLCIIVWRGRMCLFVLANCLVDLTVDQKAHTQVFVETNLNLIPFILRREQCLGRTPQSMAMCPRVCAYVREKKNLDMFQVFFLTSKCAGKNKLNKMKHHVVLSIQDLLGPRPYRPLWFLRYWLSWLSDYQIQIIMIFPRVLRTPDVYGCRDPVNE